HDWRKLDKVARRRHRDYVRGAGDNPVAPVAKGIARDASLLCFDEFHVSDIADAMLLSRLFSALFDRGVVMVATSNRAPQDLYKDGLNRELFVPFIDLLGRRLDIVSLNGERDHRRRAGQTQLYYTPLDQQTQAALETHWQKMCAGQKPEHKTLSVQGRTLDLLCAGGTGRADFATLCQTARGAADYLELTRHVSTLIVENVPVMGPDMAGAAKRFATLIDTLYEAGTRLIISAQAGPDGLYPQGVGSFEFARTASRLLEMCSQAYWNRAREKA
ncbi:MAG TPA: cell division protein ZapE, partial [Hellea balneolensis]|nr:cell division protein ZapE [Hellea balneolensis]